MRGESVPTTARYALAVTAALAVATAPIAAKAGNPAESYIKACDNEASTPEKQGEDCIYLAKIYLDKMTGQVHAAEGQAALAKGAKLYEQVCQTDVYVCLKYANKIEEYKFENPPKTAEQIRSDTKVPFEDLCSQKNDAIACHLRGLLYQDGLWGSKVDEDKALALFTKACKNGNPKLTGYIVDGDAGRRACDAQAKMEEKQEQDKKKERFYKPRYEIEKVTKVKDLEKLCDTDGEPEACNLLADMYESGKGASKNEGKAKAYRQKAFDIWSFACQYYGVTWQCRSNGYECQQAGYALLTPQLKNENLAGQYLHEGYTRLGGGCVTGKIYEQCYWKGIQCKRGIGTLTSGPEHGEALDKFKEACAGAKDAWIKKQACYQVDLYKTSPSGTPYDPKTELSKDGKWRIGDAERLAEKGDKCEKICGGDVAACAAKLSSSEPNIQNTRRMTCYGPESAVWGSDNPTWTLQTCIDKCRDCVKGGVRVWQGAKCSVCAYGYGYHDDKLYCYATANAWDAKYCNEQVGYHYKGCIADAQQELMWHLFPTWRKAAMAECQGYKKDNIAECKAIAADFKMAMAAAKTDPPETFKLRERCCHRDEVDGQGRNVLHVAAGAGNLALVKYLVAGPDADNRVEVFAKDNAGKTALDLAEKAGHAEVVAFLKANGAKRGGEYPPVFPFGSEQEVPTFAKISPPGGSAGAMITVTGDHLDNERAVYKLGATKLKPTELGKNKLVFAIPKNAKTGYFSVTIGGWTGEYKDEVPIYKAPKLTSAKPAFAVVGEQVTLKGANLEIIQKLTLGGKEIAIASKDSKTIVFTVPAKAATGALAVEGPGGSAGLKKDYEIFYPPVVKKVAPASARLEEELVVTGEHLDAQKATFKLGKEKLKVVEATATTAKLKLSKKSKTGKLSVEAKKKTSELADDFVVHQPPKLTAAKPAAAKAGEVVKLSGQNLEIVTELKLGELSVKIDAKEQKALSFTVPAKAQTGKLKVAGPGGEAELKKDFAVKAE